ncbi:zinc knuckle CX2CX4HX4C containing protein [Tanacetum coccineum]
MKPVNMTMEIADRTKSIPKGIVENLLVKIDRFIFPIDFVILDMVEDFIMPIILGIPLLATTHAEIDVFRKLISLEVGNEKVVFKIEDNFNETLTHIKSNKDFREESGNENEENLIDMEPNLDHTQKENSYDKKGVSEDLEDESS